MDIERPTIEGNSYLEARQKDEDEASTASLCSRLSIPGGRPTEVRAEQEMHCCGPLDEFGTIRVQLLDGGGGDYVVLHAADWAFDTPEDVRSFGEWVCSLFPENDPSAGTGLAR
jgi:hypothetical protein